MEEYLPVLQNTALFAGLSATQILEALACLGAQKRSYGKGEAIFHAGQRISCMGVLLCGQVHIQREDHWGNRSLLAEIGPGELFGEAYAVGEEPMCNDAVACRESVALLLDTGRLLAPCAAACGLHARLLQRLFAIFAQKNRVLAQKLGCLSQRTTRQKLLYYLSEQAKKAGGGSFSIPFNRQQLADYLSVDRSAMCAELGRMRREGLLEFKRNRFVLK